MLGTYVFDWQPVIDGLPELLEGAFVSLQIAVLAFVIGSVIAFLLAAAKASENPAISFPARAWIEVARNTPCLFQVYLLYFGLGGWLNISSYNSVLFAIAFNTAGYMAEIIRGGLKAIPSTQERSARGLGLSRAQASLFVLIPQLIPIIYFPSINQFIWSLLNTSLGMIVGLNELTGVASSLQSISFRTFEFFLVTAAMYYVMVKLTILVSQIGARAFIPGWTKGAAR